MEINVNINMDIAYVSTLFLTGVNLEVCIIMATICSIKDKYNIRNIPLFKLMFTY